MSSEMPPPNTPEEGVAATNLSSRAEARRIIGSGVPSTIYDSPASSAGGSRRSSLADFDPYQIPLRAHTQHQTEPTIDFQALDYAQQVDEALLCPICHTPFYLPMTTKTCGHTFCASCLDRALETQHVCPIDRRPLDIARDITQTQTRVILDQLDRLKAKCPNTGCDHVCSRELLRSHVERYCEYTQVPCPDPQCDETIYRKDARPENGCLHQVTLCPYCETALTFNDLERHYDQECTGQEAECPYCDTIVVRHRLPKHIATDCQEVETHCKFQSAGCKQFARRKNIQEHQKDGCVYEAIAKLMQAREEDQRIITELKGRLDALDGRTRHLERYGGGNRESREPSAFTRAAPPTQGLTAHALNNLNQMHQATTAYPDVAEANENIMLDELFETFDQGNIHHYESSYGSPQVAPVMMPPDAPPVPWAQPNGGGQWESAEDYMLAQFEAMEAKIEDLRKMMVELDGRHTMRLVNDTMRMNEQIAELGSKVGVLGMHTTWLMSMQRQSRGQQTAAGGSTPGNARSNISGTGGGGGGGSGNGGSAGNNDESRGRTNTAAAGGSGSSRTATQQGNRNGGDGDGARGRYLNTSEVPPVRRSSVARGENPPRL
ncbi:hypothetical protein B0T20DRAFT_57335 [Sordaria brevicollis]|uniref:Uncharacterized protein n=1 Tax=Sordaria brevicollis TaxID=83679 RepID=A0AAE0U6K1_SORBR|nr:hypothetical protein B0T20DRAFT_57335 [Sordaria brevicollis]